MYVCACELTEYKFSYGNVFCIMHSCVYVQIDISKLFTLYQLVCGCYIRVGSLVLSQDRVTSVVPG